MRNFHQPGRSTVYATKGAIATSHYLSSGAGLEVLRSGGNALDAAVTAAAVQAVVEPQMTSAGGDLFALVAFPDGRIEGFNASGRAAAAIDPDALIAKGMRDVPVDHGLAVTVPGGVAGWCRLLENHGKIGIDRALEPAIALARDGFPVAPRVAFDWSHSVDKLSRDPGARKHLLTASGEAPNAGDVMVNEALARTLGAVARDGEKAFYSGEIADDIAATVQAAGGFLTVEDLANVSVDPMTPLSAGYRNREIVELPPNTQGFIAQLMLRILEGFDLAKLDPLGPERFHLELETARLAYAVRDRHLSDPQSQETTSEDWLADKAVDALRARIDPDRRMADTGSLETPGSDTVMICAVDENRMAVALINSIFKDFGSGIVTEKTGIVLQNRGAGFVLSPGHPNCISGGKRPLHTLIPGLMKQSGTLTHTFGVMGGQYQACGHAHFITNVVDYGMDPQEAIDFPRMFLEPHGDNAGVSAENTIPKKTLDGLVARGHDVFVADSPWGGAQAIGIDEKRGVLIAGSDPRKDGCALGY